MTPADILLAQFAAVEPAIAGLLWFAGIVVVGVVVTALVGGMFAVSGRHEQAAELMEAETQEMETLP